MKLKDALIAGAIGWMLRGHVERERQLRRRARELRRAQDLLRTVCGK